MKPISADKSTVRPFKTHMSQTYTYTVGNGSNPTQVTVDVGEAPIITGSVWNFDPSTEPKNSDGIYTHTLYYSVKNLFYNTSSFWDLGSSFVTGSIISRGFEPSGSFYAINIPQSAVGEGILPGSFKIKQSNTVISDDGKGRLSSGQGTIGNIFYHHGIAIIQRDSVGNPSSGSILPNAMNLKNGDVFSVDFKSTHTIYEHQIVCTMNPSDFNYSTNSTALFGNESNGQRIYSLIASGSLVPYFTTLGLYNEQSELVMVAKLVHPLKRATETDQTIIIRFDT